MSRLLRMKSEMARVDENPPTECTKYEFVRAIRALDQSLYASLMRLYSSSVEIQFFWNTVNDLDRANADFQRLSDAAGLDDVKLYDIFHWIGIDRVRAKYGGA